MPPKNVFFEKLKAYEEVKNKDHPKVWKILTEHSLD